MSLYTLHVFHFFYNLNILIDGLYEGFYLFMK